MEKSTTIVVVVALVAIVGITVLVLKQGGGAAAGPVPMGDGSNSAVEAVVWASGVSDLAGAQFDVRYNPSVVRYASASEGDFLDNGAAGAAMLLDTAKDEQGSVKNVILLRVQQPGVDGTGDLATLAFTRIAEGDAGITLENVLASDSAGNPINPSALSVRVS